RRLRGDSLAQDVRVPLIKRGGALRELPPEECAEFLIGQSLVRRRPLGGQELHQGAVLIRPEGGVQGDVPAPQALSHLDDVALADVQAVGEELGVGHEALAFQLALLFVQIVEELALVLRGPDLYQPVGVQEIPKNVRPHPPGCVRVEPHALRSEEHMSELQSRVDLVCRLLLEKKKTKIATPTQERAILGYLDTTRYPSRDRVMFLMYMKAWISYKKIAFTPWSNVRAATVQLDE